MLKDWTKKNPVLRLNWIFGLTIFLMCVCFTSDFAVYPVSLFTVAWFAETRG